VNVQLSFQGGAQLAKALEQAGAALERRLVMEALKAAADPLRRDMAARMARSPFAPHAADSVIVAEVKTIDGEKLGPREFAVGVAPTREFFYWFFQEFGTVQAPAQPAMRPAFDAGVERALRDIGHALWDGIAKYADTARSTTSRFA